MKSTSTLLAGATCIAAALLAAALPATAASSAQVSEIVKEVSISGRQASLGDSLSGNTALKTGSHSRAELTFEDSTLLRVGSNTVFSFLGTKGKSKEFSLTQGTAFVATPATHGGVKVRCGGVTAAIEGCFVTLGWTPQGLFIGVAHETTDEGGAGVSFGGHNFKTNQAGFIPLDANGNLDFSKATYFAYDGAAQLKTGFVSANLPPELIEIAETAKNRSYSTNQVNNAPGVEGDETDISKIDQAGSLPSTDTPPCPPKKKWGWGGWKDKIGSEGEDSEVEVHSSWGDGDWSETAQMCRNLGGHDNHCNETLDLVEVPTGTDHCPEAR